MKKIIICVILIMLSNSIFSAEDVTLQYKDISKVTAGYTSNYMTSEAISGVSIGLSFFEKEEKTGKNLFLGYALNTNSIFSDDDGFTFFAGAGPQIVYCSANGKPWLSVSPQFAFLTLENIEEDRIIVPGFNLKAEVEIIDYKQFTVNAELNSFYGKDYSEDTGLYYQLYSVGINLGYKF